DSGWSQVETARAVKTSQSFIHEVLHGEKSPSKRTLALLEEKLGERALALSRRVIQSANDLQDDPRPSNRSTGSGEEHLDRRFTELSRRLSDLEATLRTLQDSNSTSEFR